MRSVILQQLDYIRLRDRTGGESLGTIAHVHPDGSACAWMDYSAGQLVLLPAARLASATLLCRNNQRVTPC
jgi:hypothetical protein